MSRIERSNEKYNRAMVKELLRADKMPPEKRTSNIKELLEYLNEDDPAPSEQLPERLWCTACGTVTRDGICDCNRYGADREPHFVNYADAMQQTAHEQAQTIDALVKALQAITAPIKPELCKSELDIIIWWGRQVARLQDIAGDTLARVGQEGSKP